MRILISFMVTMGVAFGVSAAPITEFETSYSGSSVEAKNITGFNTGDLDLSLSDALKTMKFSLEEGESKSFDFFHFSLPPVYGSADVDATLDFLVPYGGEGSSQGDASWFTTLLFSAGSLEWDKQPGLIELDNGTSFNLAFENLAGLQLGNKNTVQATVTSVSAASVPEPGTLALLGMGLLGLGLSRSRRN